MIVEPTGFDREHVCEIPTPSGVDCVTFSGYAKFLFTDNNNVGGPTGASGVLHGVEDRDERWEAWTVRMVVGPKFRGIRCASPSVFVGGYVFNNSDTVDDSGVHIDSLTWDTVGLPPPETNLERLRIEVKMRIRGGLDFKVTNLGYQATLVGIQ